MPVKLHVCPITWGKVDRHPCHRVRQALDDAGIPYELVEGPLIRGRRQALFALSGQRLYPVIELEDGSVIREDSQAMADRIRAGRLLDPLP